jgi:nucleoside-diphosphate-sugar epimerase
LHRYITGGAGFVGSHLVDRLLERGDSVIVVDNFFTGRKENIMHNLNNPYFEMIRRGVSRSLPSVFLLVLLFLLFLLLLLLLLPA